MTNDPFGRDLIGWNKTNLSQPISQEFGRFEVENSPFASPFPV